MSEIHIRPEGDGTWAMDIYNSRHTWMETQRGLTREKAKMNADYEKKKLRKEKGDG